MSLAEIRDVVTKFANTISRILNVDVMIVDQNLNRIANTYHYVDEPEPIRQMSIIGQVIISGQVIAIQDKQTYHACQVCPDLEACTMTGFIGVPILYRNRVAGAIALIMKADRVNDIFRDARTAIEFLEGMADLISSKIENDDDYKNLNIIKREQEILMDAIENAMISTDEIGYIKYFNKKAARFFGLKKECIGQYIKDVIPHRLISEFLTVPNDFTNKLIYIELEDHPFYGFLSCLNISINGQRSGMLFSFKSLSNINEELNEINFENVHSTFDWAEQGYLASATIDAAKRLSINNKSILIIGEQGSGKEMLAKAIHNFSDRSGNGFITVDCGGLYMEILEQSIFGDDRQAEGVAGLGKLQLAHKGTIYFHRINKMPMYLQKRVVDFLKTGTIRQAFVRDIQIDVRLIFSSDEDLAGLMREGMFDDELYYRISENTIEIQPLRKDRASMLNILRKNIRFYKQKYHKEPLEFEPAVMECLQNYGWPGNMMEIEHTIDSLVYHCNDQVRMADLKPYPMMQQMRPEIKTMKEMEKEKILQMLSVTRNKDEVARMLNIGRATLYRKLKEYQINAKEQ